MPRRACGRPETTESLKKNFLPHRIRQGKLSESRKRSFPRSIDFPALSN
jgi:hypothetical protein